jgi:hypothetical protein
MISHHNDLPAGLQDRAVGQCFGEIIIRQALLKADGPDADNYLVSTNFCQSLLRNMTYE